MWRGLPAPVIRIQPGGSLAGKLWSESRSTGSKLSPRGVCGQGRDDVDPRGEHANQRAHVCNFEEEVTLGIRKWPDKINASLDAVGDLSRRSAVRTSRVSLRMGEAHNNLFERPGLTPSEGSHDHLRTRPERRQKVLIGIRAGGLSASAQGRSACRVWSPAKITRPNAVGSKFVTIAVLLLPSASRSRGPSGVICICDLLQCERITSILSNCE
ncbi:hypothetical protein MicloDRAFT_00004000 [Microvirga lotononidis]|uniref:Uncharacterized protein n=1 Tax=Microvirga lotononidis TaxID=864069 RepID=I4Z3T1_9HYPH|nr:hypothetical protein MicloDRAFT_00004000 [Microvirga lotononidis]